MAVVVDTRSAARRALGVMGLVFCLSATACSSTSPPRSSLTHQGPPLGHQASTEPSTRAAPATVESAAGCPSRRTCADHVVVGVGWTPDAAGDVVIHYRINPTLPRAQALNAAEVVSAITAAAATWQQSDPHLELVYDGVTSDRPDDNNVIGFVDGGPSGNTHVSHGPGGYYGGRYIRFDVQFDQNVAWSWLPCRPVSGRTCATDAGATGVDLQDVATHEWGHVVGLEHVVEPWDSELVMWAGGQATSVCPTGLGCRWRDTLGLGDVLGVRSLYPTAAPLPPINSL